MTADLPRPPVTIDMERHCLRWLNGEPDADPPGVLEASIGQPVAGRWLARRIVWCLIIIVLVASMLYGWLE